MPTNDDPQAELQVNHLDYIQWYKEDGTPTAGKLPQDPYHVAKFTDRGWSRRPPVRFITDATDES